MSDGVAGRELLARIDAVLGDELRQVERVFVDELDSRYGYVRDIHAHVGRFRGKRLRPVLLLLSASACGGIRPAHHVLAAVVEMIHTATLVHDDVLDEAETRRHVATVNSRWNNETSVLFGDFLFTHAFHLAASLDSTHACRRIGRSTNIVCEGELTQIHHRGNLDLDEAGYLDIIDGKTAELCAVSSYLGARYAEAAETECEAMEAYGRSLGMAFQIADDLLDILGTEQETGKSLGSDYRKQKMTLPLIRLLATADDATAAHLRELLQRPNGTAWQELEATLQQSDAVDYARRRAGEFAAAAREQLRRFPASEALQILEGITEFATQRAF